MKNILCTILLGICTQQLGAFFYLGPRCKLAYKSSYEGKFEKADSILNEVLNEENAQHTALYLKGFNAFFSTIFFENDSLDHVVISTLEPIIKELKNAPEHEFKRFAVAELLVQKGMIELRQENFVVGMLNLRKAYIEVEKNRNEFPDFKLSDKTYFTLQALLSNVPDNLKGLVEFFGYKTDQYFALKKLNELQGSLNESSDYAVFRREVNLYRAVLMNKLTENYQEAYDIIRDNTQDYARSPVSCFIRGKMALDSKKTSEAIEVLEHFAGSECPFPYINYDLGNAYLYMLNKKCLLYFAYFIKQSPGAGLKKDTYLKLAWWSYMQGDEKMTDRWLSFIEDHKTSSRERDKVAVKEGQNVKKTHPSIIKARLAFDGGFYQYSLKTLLQSQEELTNGEFNAIRYHYYKARNFYDLKNYEKASKSFSSVVEYEFNKEEYFIPVSYFYLAQICENGNANKAAIVNYQKCLNYKSYPYSGFYQYKSELAIKRLAS